MMDDNNKTYRVFELNQVIKEVIEGSCPYPIWVQGELSDFDKNAQRFNIYFQLSEKDKAKNETLSSIRCVLYESRKNRLRQRLKDAGIRVQGMDGLEVRLKVRLSVSARSGSYLLTVEDIDPSFTLGQLAQNRQRIIKSLEERGLLKKNKALELSSVPLKIGLITNEGEGYHDFIAKLKDSGFGFEVFFYQANVQGPRTEKDIVSGIKLFETMADQIDALVVVRGGGATTDLGWFDSQLIAEAIASFPQPVLTGIGHFTNVSVADLVAHHYLATPTAVAEFLIERVKSFNLRTDYYAEQIKQKSRISLDQAQQMVDNQRLLVQRQGNYLIGLANQRIFSCNDSIQRESARAYRQSRQQVDLIRDNIVAALQKVLQNERKRQTEVEGRLRLLDPKNIMRRGFSVTRFQGHSLKSIQQLKRGDQIETVLFQGKIKSSVDKLN